MIGNNDPAFHAVLDRLRVGQVLVDFVRISSRPARTGRMKDCW